MVYPLFKIVLRFSAQRISLELCKFLTLFPPGLTYDEVISFVPPPLDQEEMES